LPLAQGISNASTLLLQDWILQEDEMTNCRLKQHCCEKRTSFQAMISCIANLASESELAAEMSPEGEKTELP
jgi:hypothetical protein